ncbi:NAD(P)H-binding protein [Nocardiopsis halophila]|uniref:NAD(P)H-binding protein n=1 Tax=Nocardiopsis halophila TaxID=141692 RepID=UPI000348A56F|nr:NAD(P)H-binding protein [Nocardiopsis halophila]
MTGATGTVGGALATQLAETHHEIVALTRDVNRADGLPASVEWAEGDFRDPERLRNALSGVDRMYLFSDAATVHTVVSAAADCGLDRLVVLTSPVDGTAGNPVKEAVRASGIDWTFVEPGPFAMNARDWWSYPIRHFGAVRWVYPKARIAPVHEADVADVVATVLLEDGHTGREYTISGPESLTQQEQVAVIGEVLGKEIPFQEISPEEGKELLMSHGVPAEIADWVVATLAQHVDAPSVVDDPAERITGRPGRTFAQWVAEHADDFRPGP